MAPQPASEFSSEGFDLDTASEDVVLEVGGGVTPVEPPVSGQTKEETNDDNSPIGKSEEFKALGNDNFKAGAYLEAYDMYTEAIQACPGMTGEAILKEKQVYEEAQHEQALEQQRIWDADRRDKGDKQEKPERPPPLEPYKAPMHVYGDKLAVYHSNRAAVCMHLKRYDEAIADCDVSVLLYPTYTKAWMRRSAAYEATERIEEALRDAKQAQLLEPANVNTLKTVRRLQKMEDERLEKLKEETMGKLKELGNSILGNFGLSLDNFNATQGPDGNYSISFNQGQQK